MAGWLAWNLRIVTGVAIALCGYYGADYWSNKDTQRNIERINYQEEQESEEGILNHLQLGEEKPQVAKKYFEKMNSGSGGGVTGSKQLMKETERKCKENPNSLIHGTDLIDRRYCRLYWSVKEDINILVKTENEHILLSSKDNKDDTGWKTAWEKYKEKKPWGEITAQGDEVPKAFKDKCEEKAKGSVNDIEDPEYKQVIDYCSRNKTIKDVLDEKDIKLLGTDGNAETWRNRFNEYKSTNIGERFSADQAIESDENLKTACSKTINMETKVNNYKNLLSVVARYCKEQ